MKKINFGSVYDTETSKKLAKWEGDKTEETLYITKSGKYFLYTEDNTIFKLNIQKDGKGWLRGIDIIPLNLDQAKQWGKERLTNEEYSSIFEHKSELGSKVTLNLSVSSECKAILERNRSKTGKSISQIVSNLVMQHLDQDGQE